MKLRSLLMLSAALTLTVSACSSSSESDPKPTQGTENQPTVDPEKGDLGITMGDLEQDRWTENTPLKLKDTIVEATTTFVVNKNPWDYSGSYINLDLKPVCTAFAMNEIQFENAVYNGEIQYIAINPDGRISENKTAQNGFWFNEAGKVIREGNSSVFAITSDDFRIFNVMQNPTVIQPATTYSAMVALQYQVEDTVYTAKIKFVIETAKIYTAEDFDVVATFEYNIKISREGGYSGGEAFFVDPDDLCEALAITESDFLKRLGATTTIVPLNADGTDGDNTAGGDYGGWFDHNGTTPWGQGDLTFLEIGHSTPFAVGNGCHQSHVQVGEVVTMRLQYRDVQSLKACNIVVNATIVD